MNDAIQRLLNDSKANTLPTQDRTATNDRESFGADFGLPRRDESRLLNLIAERILNPREQRELSIEESKRVVSEQIYDILLEQNRKLSEDHLATHREYRDIALKVGAMPVPESQIEVEAIRREKNNLSRLLKETLDSNEEQRCRIKGLEGQVDLVRNKVQIEDSGETLRRENLALNERILSLENDKSNLAIEKDKFKKMLELAEREMTDMRLRHSEEKRALKIEVERHCEKIFERRSDLLRDTAAKSEYDGIERMREVNKAIEEIRKENCQLRKDNEKLVQEALQAKSKGTSLENNLTKLRNDLDKAESQLSLRENELKQLNFEKKNTTSSSEEKNRMIEELNERAAVAEREVDKLKRSVEFSKNKIADLEAACHEARIKTTDLTKTREELVEANRKLQDDLGYSKSDMQELQLKFTEVAAQLSVLKNKEKEFSESRYEQIRMESEIEGLKGLLIKKMEEQPTTPIPNPAQSNTVVSETQDLASGPEMNKSSFDQTERPTSGSRMPVLPSSELESINEKIAELTGLNGQLIKENEALKQDNFTLKGKLRFCLSTYINPNDTQPTFSSVKLTNAAPAPSREVNLLASQAMKVFRDSKQNQAKTTVSNESSSNSTTNNLLDKLSKKVYTLGTSSGLLEKRPEQQNQVQFAEKPQTLKSCLKQGDTTVGSRLLDLCSIKPKQSSPTQPQPQTATLQASSNPNIANPTSRRETNPVWTTGVSNQVRPPNYGYSQQQVIIPKLSPPRRVIEGPAVYQPRTSVQNGTTRLIQPLPSSIPQFQTISSTVTRNPVQYKTNQVYNDERQFEQARGYRNILPQNIDGIPVGRSLSNTSSLERDEPRHMQTRPTYNTLDHPLQQVSNQILIAQQRTHSASSNGDKRSNSEKSEKERLEEHIRRIQSDLRSDSLKRTPSHSPPPQIIRGPGDGLATAGLRQSNLVPHNLGGASIVHTNAGVQRMAPVVQHGRVGSYVQSQVNGQTYNQMSSLPIDQLRSGSLDYSESSGHEAGFRSTIDRGSLQGQGRPSSLSRQILGTPRFGEEF